MKNANKLFIIPAFIGIIGGFSALFVRYVIDFSLFSSQLLDYFGKKNEIYLVVIPVMFVISSIIIRRFLSDATNPTIDSVAKSIVLKKADLITRRVS